MTNKSPLAIITPEPIPFDFLDIKMFKKELYLNHNYPTVSKYKLCLTGTIAAGKSSILTALCEMFSRYEPKDPNQTFFTSQLSNLLGSQQVCAYPENWTLDEVGLKLLQRKIAGSVSVVTFQNYVIDEWVNNIKRNYNVGFNIIHLFERNIDDTVFSFCNFAHKNNELTDLEFKSLFDRSNYLQKYYSIPSYSNTRNFAKIESSNNFWTDVLMIAKIIESDIYENGIEQRIIGMDITNEEAINRVANRNRKEEAGYTEDYIIEFNQFYKKLFRYLESEEFLTSAEELNKVI
jgi:deoxyadenosine/deoxycytidine kinase